MKDTETSHYLKRFHNELGDVINSLLNRIEANGIPDEVEFYEVPVRIRNQWISLGFSVKTKEFYLVGKSSDHSYEHIML